MDGAKARADATRVRPMVTIKHDFAAAMEITQKETLCAQHALTHHLYVASVSWNPRRVPIPNSVRQARTKKNRAITHALIRDTLLAFLYSEHDQNVSAKERVGWCLCVYMQRWRVWW